MNGNSKWSERTTACWLRLWIKIDWKMLLFQLAFHVQFQANYHRTERITRDCWIRLKSQWTLQPVMQVIVIKTHEWRRARINICPREQQEHNLVRDSELFCLRERERVFLMVLCWLCHFSLEPKSHRCSCYFCISNCMQSYFAGSSPQWDAIMQCQRDLQTKQHIVFISYFFYCCCCCFLRSMHASSDWKEN